MPNMKVLEYTIREQTPNGTPPVAQPTQDYATHAEVEALTAQLNALKAELESMTKKGATLNE